MAAKSMGEWARRLQQAAVKAVSEDDLREVMQALVTRAKRGDLPAIQLLMKYVAPAPAPAPLVNLNVTRPRVKPRKVEALPAANGDGTNDE